MRRKILIVHKISSIIYHNGKYYYGMMSLFMISICLSQDFLFSCCCFWKIETVHIANIFVIERLKWKLFSWQIEIFFDIKNIASHIESSIKKISIGSNIVHVHSIVININIWTLPPFYSIASLSLSFIFISLIKPRNCCIHETFEKNSIELHFFYILCILKHLRISATFSPSIIIITTTAAT